MRLIEILDNPNCQGTERVFHDVEAPQPVACVRVGRDGGSPAWYELTGWTTAGDSCGAHLQKVDDSGAGVSFLVFGGDAGLRLRPAGASGPWSLNDEAQWGEPFLLLGDVEDVRRA